MESVPEDMWSPFKELYSALIVALNDPNGGGGGSGSLTMNLELCLKRRESNFMNFLRNPPKNEKNRAELLKSCQDAATVDGRQMSVSKDLIDESIILSDMFDLDEFHALEMLRTAQRQLSQHAELPRASVAFLLYYDGRKALSCTLRDLFENTAGVLWTPDLPQELLSKITTFTQKLVDESNILGRLIQLLEGQLNIDKEFELLTKNREFGPKKHQNQVRKIFEDTRLAIATSLFHWSAQRGLPKLIILRLLHYLCKYKATSKSSTVSHGGRIDNVGVTLLMALVYSFDTSILQRQEDNNIYVKRLPILSEVGFANAICDKLTRNLNGKNQWNNYECFVKFCFGLSLANLRHAPINLQIGVHGVIDRDIFFVDNAIAMGIFDFIFNDLLENELIFINEFFYRRLHLAITDFIDYMHPAVNDLRGRIDDPSILDEESSDNHYDTGFESLMLCIGKLYKGNPLNLSLCDEFWYSLDANIFTNINYQTVTSRSGNLLNFIRMAGMSITLEIFEPYIKMLVGLTSSETSARKVFNLLKQSQSILKPIYTPDTLKVGWDHFFAILRTYINSDQVSSKTFDANYDSSSIQNRIISPSDIAGLQAILSLIGNVAHHDEISRIVFSQTKDWTAINSLLGLLGCSSVPISLKAEILFTLSAMAKSRESAATIWLGLEITQLIKTVPAMHINWHKDTSFDIDIEKYESRNEEYPLTRGILALLCTLVKTIVPVSLGNGTRKPGLYPYLKFLVDNIFLRFYNWMYKKEIEKWEVGAECLKVLYHLLESYNPKPEDFIEQSDSYTPAGYYLMLELNLKSDIIRLILILIEDACKILGDYSNFPGKDKVENCALYSLLIVEYVLLKQNDFYESLSKSNSSVDLIGIHQLLMDMNPRTMRPDHLLNIMKFVTFNNWLPTHALASIKILHIIFGFSKVSGQILNICDAHSNNLFKLEIRQGFVECLDSIDVKISDNTSDNKTTTIISSNTEIIDPTIPIQLQIKDAILKLMLRCVKQPMPNFGYFLLGYTMRREVSSANNDQSSSVVIDTRINCMMSLIVKIEKNLIAYKNNIAASSSVGSGDYIAERCWYLIYNLCAYPGTSEITLQYLRSCYNDVILRHLAAIQPSPSPPQQRSPYKQEHATYSAHLLHQMSYILKCVTIELKWASVNNQINRFSTICEILFGSIESPSSSQASSNQRLEYVRYLLQANDGLHPSPPSIILDHRNEAIANMHICFLLDYISPKAKEKCLPELHFFDENKLPVLLSCCEEDNLINIENLSNILHDAPCTVESTIESDQRQSIIDEIELILAHAVELNSELTQFAATDKFMVAWSQLTELLFTCVPEAAMARRLRKKYIIDIIEQLLIKLVRKKIRREIALSGSKTILLLVSNLRYCFYKLGDDSLVNENEKTTMTSDIQSSNALKNTTLHLRFIMKGVLDWILLTFDESKSSENLRINLYTVFSYCLSIVKRFRKIDEDGDYENGTSLSDYNGQTFSFSNMVIEVINSFGDKLIDILCYDIIKGMGICRITAFSALNLILEIEPVAKLVQYIAIRGYLGCIIESLRDSDEALSNILAEVPDSLKELHIYESKMSFLLRYASSYIGSYRLLTQKFLEVLSNMKVFDMRPDMEINLNVARIEYSLNDNNNSNLIPDVDERYRSILFPALAILDSMLTTLGTDDHLARRQIKIFLYSHSNMIETILRTATPYKSLGVLKELSSITSIIARTASRDNEQSDKKELLKRPMRIQKLMLSLYERFVINKTTFEKMLNPEDITYNPTEENKNLHVKYFLEIATNIALYCRKLITCCHEKSVFTSFTNVQLLNGITAEPMKLTTVTNIILAQLKGSVDWYITQKSLLDILMQERSSLSNNLLDAQAKIRHQELMKSCRNKQEMQALVVLVTEQNIYLLWCYLSFYLKRVKSYDEEGASALHEVYIASPTVSYAEFHYLKQTLISTFNETFCDQLLSTSENVKVGKSFTEVMLRRIKTLIQFAAVPIPPLV